MKKRVVSIIFTAVIIAILIAIVYLVFFYSKKCNDASCFNSAMIECKRASYLNDERDAAWLYKIEGKSEEKCKVYVELVKLKEGGSELLSLEAKNMDCMLELGTATSPQGNLENCHGLLKEEMQKIIINRLHNYVKDNLGIISEELNKAI